MKKTYLVLVATLAVMLSSCGFNSALILNSHQNSTQVHLSSNNYKVIDKVKGSAEVEYILGIGGLDARQLYQNAYASMADKANLTSGSRALINVVHEEHVGGVPPFYYKRTITVSATVIEFTR